MQNFIVTLEAEINALQHKRDIATMGSETIDEIRRISEPFDAQIAHLHARIDAYIAMEMEKTRAR